MTATRKAPDVAVVGGGIIGCSLAHALADRGASVVILERARPAREATWAAGGMLSPLGESLRPGPFLELALESFRRYPAFLHTLREASGHPVEIVRSGKMQVTYDAEGAEKLTRRLEWLEAHDFPARWLDPEEARAREPALSPELRGALLLAEEGQVDNRLLGRAAADAARAAGAEIVCGTPVRAVLARAGRVSGVEMEDGSRLDAGSVVVAAGAWSGQIQGLPRPLPVRPVRGQMLSLDVGPGTLSTIVETSSAYLIPRPDGPLVVGSTVEEVGFDPFPTDAGIQGLLSAAVQALPELKGAPPLDTWAGLRPGTPDDLPILGEDPELPGLYYATGHFRNGILLAPVTSASLAPLVLGDELPLDLSPFRAERFTGSFLVSDEHPA